jgi:pyruvate formate lyase activating enzyme
VAILGGSLPAPTLASGVVFDIRRFSVHDGPGIRTTVFLKGCPLRCPWCHNPEGLSAAPELVWRSERCSRCGSCIAACPEDALEWVDDLPTLDASRCTLCGICADECYAQAREVVGRAMDADAVLAQVERDLPFYEESGGGVTFSGGEPLAQPEFLAELLRGAQARGIHTALDTCGYAPWNALDDLRTDVDLFLYDLKLVDEERHRSVTGVSNAAILDNLERLAERGHRIVLRLPLVPDINDDEPNLRAIGGLAARLGVERVVVLPLHRLGRDKYARLGRTYELSTIAIPTDAHVAQAIDLLRGAGAVVERME